MIDYHNKIFRSVSNTGTGEVNNETLFFYEQEGNIVTAKYKGGGIASGHLIAIKDADGKLTMHYHHVNSNGNIMTGICFSQPQILPGGKIRLHEKWQWTSGDNSSGESIVDEV